MFTLRCQRLRKIGTTLWSSTVKKMKSHLERAMIEVSTETTARTDMRRTMSMSLIWSTITKQHRVETSRKRRNSSPEYKKASSTERLTSIHCPQSRQGPPEQDALRQSSTNQSTGGRFTRPQLKDGCSTQGCVQDRQKLIETVSNLAESNKARLRTPVFSKLNNNSRTSINWRFRSYKRKASPLEVQVVSIVRSLQLLPPSGQPSKRHRVNRTTTPSTFLNSSITWKTRTFQSWKLSSRASK